MYLIRQPRETFVKILARFLQVPLEFKVQPFVAFVVRDFHRRNRARFVGNKGLQTRRQRVKRVEDIVPVGTSRK